MNLRNQAHLPDAHDSFKAVLRRSSAKYGNPPKEADSKVLERGRLRMDPERHTSHYRQSRQKAAQKIQGQR